MDEKIKRSEIDDIGRRNLQEDSFKNRGFAGKRSTEDAYTGDKVFYASQGHFTTKTTANIDHIVTIDQMIENYGQSLDKADLRRIVNSDYNLAITSEALNKSKSGQSNHEFLLKQLRKGNPRDLTTTYNMLVKETSARTGMTADIAITKAGRLGGSLGKAVPGWAAEAGSFAGNTVGKSVEAGLVALTVSSLTNLALVGAGRKDTKTALKDIAEDVKYSGLSRAGVECAQKVVSGIAAKCDCKAVAKALGKTGLPVAELAMAAMAGAAIGRYLRGGNLRGGLRFGTYP